MARHPMRRGASRRHDPMGTLPITALDTHEEPKVPAPSTTEKSPHILTQLVAKEPGDRAWAAATCSNMMCDQDNRKVLLSNGLIDRLLSGLRIELNFEVLLEFVGALRNLVSSDPTIIDELNKKGIMVEIEAIVLKCRALLEKKNHPDLPSSERDAIAVVNPLISNVFSLLNALCVASKPIIQLITTHDRHIIPFILDLIRDARTFPLVAVTAAMTLMEVLTEDNTKIVDKVPSDFVIQILPAFFHDPHSDPQVAIAAAGIIYNMRAALRHSPQFPWVSEIVGYVQMFLDSEATQGLVPEILTYLGQVPVHGSDPVQIEMETDQNEKVQVPIEGTVDKQFDKLSLGVSTVATAFELLANCTSNLVEPGLNDSEEWADVDDDFGGADGDAGMDADSDLADEDMGDVIEKDTSNDDSSTDIHMLSEEFSHVEPTLDEAVLTSIIKLTQTPDQAKFAAMIPMLLSYAQTQVPDLDTAQSTSNMRELASSLTMLRTRSLAVLNNTLFAMLALPKSAASQHPYPVLNLLVSVESMLTPKPKTVQSLFNSLTSIVHSLHRSAELVSMAVGSTWGLVRNFDTTPVGSSSRWINVPSEYIQGMIDLYRKIDDVGVRVKIVGLLGVLGRRQPGHIETNRTIGTFLMGLLADPRAVAPEVLVEVLNAVFDVYGDIEYDYDCVFSTEMSGLAVLQKAVDSVRSITKSVDRRRQHVLRNALDETLLNLRAFIKYKCQEYGL